MKVNFCRRYLKKPATAFKVLFSICLLFILVALAAAQTPDPGKSETDKDENLSQMEKNHRLIKIFLDRIRGLSRQHPPDYKAMAEIYIVIFNSFHDYEQGKLAAWEAYELYSKIKDYDNATAVLTLILSMYSYKETMENPLDESMPISLRATARVELGRTYAQMGDVYTALGIARTVPIQYPGVYVGRFSGEKTYYGKVEHICALDSVEFSIETRNYNQSMILLIELIKNNHGTQIGTLFGKIDLEARAVELGRRAITTMPASEGKRISLFDEMAEVSKSSLALSRIHFYKADMFIDSYEKTGIQNRIDEALTQYKELLKFTETDENTPHGQMPVPIAAVIKIRKLFTHHLKDNDRALYELGAIESSFGGYDTPFSQSIAAYAEYYRGMVCYQEMQNHKQAIYFLETLMRKYPDVLQYPLLKTADPKPKLVDHVRKMIKVIRRNVI